MNEEKVIEVYHGTTKKYAKKIFREQKFIAGKDEDNEDFLGKGIYFFKNNEHAVLWNLKKANDCGKKNLQYKDYILYYSVISAKICIERKNILDLEDIKDLVKYDKICKRFKKEFEDDLEYITAVHKERAIINYFYKKRYMENIFVIRKILGQKNNTVDLNVGEYLQREVICVKNDKIIQDIEIMADIETNTYNTIKYISFC